MDILSIVVLIGLAIWFVFAIRYVVKIKRRGGCVSCGGNGTCENCNGCNKSKNENRCMRCKK